MYNPFAQNDAQNDAILDLAQEMPTRDGESTVYGWDLRFSGDLMEFNNDVIRSAFGFEFRKEEITDVPSLNARARFENDYLVDVFGFGSSLSEADRTQWGAFAEFHIPLTEQLEMQLAGRYDDYDDFDYEEDEDNHRWRIDSIWERSHIISTGLFRQSMSLPSIKQIAQQNANRTARQDHSVQQLIRKPTQPPAKGNDHE